MDKTSRKGGCFRTGCLTIIIAILFFTGAGWLMHLWSERLPSRFVLKIPVTGAIDERAADPVSVPFAGNRESLSLEELLVIFDRARTDKRVESVLLQIDGVAAPAAKIGELGNAIAIFRKSGKKVTALLRTPEDKDYQLAVACDTIIVEKGSWMLLDGLKSELFFFADPLRKLGIGFQAAQWKKYKSAVEPFTRNSPSPESVEETGALLDDAWAAYLDTVSKRRAIDRDMFRQVIDSLAVITPEKARLYGLVDRVGSVRELEKEYEQRFKEVSPEHIFVGGAGYLEATGGMDPQGGGDRIAVLTITGTIVSDGVTDMGESSGTDVASVRQALRTALDDSGVKAIVLRIDSPGGDALAASTMLELLDEAAKRKPMVASMSGVAASGGYMVALAAKSIYAQPMTVTGSIGVFALKPDFSGVLEKSGIHREVMVRGRYADAYTPFKAFDEASFRKFTEVTGVIYEDFTSKVASRRHLTDAQIEAVAGGRVWSGKRAIEVGLVDRIGGLSDAVQEAARLAGMKKDAKPELLYLPVQKTWIEQLLSGNIDAAVATMTRKMLTRSLEQSLPFIHTEELQSLRLFLNSDSPRALAIQPFELSIK